MTTQRLTAAQRTFLRSVLADATKVAKEMDLCPDFEKVVNALGFSEYLPDIKLYEITLVIPTGRDFGDYKNVSDYSPGLARILSNDGSSKESYWEISNAIDENILGEPISWTTKELSARPGELSAE